MVHVSLPLLQPVAWLNCGRTRTVRSEVSKSKGAPRGHFISETIVDQLVSPTQTDDDTGQIDKKQTNKKMKQTNKTKKSRHNKD